VEFAGFWQQFQIEYGDIRNDVPFEATKRIPPASPANLSFPES
jgi:hypothetical protein